jgi:hypothetical protein
MLNLKTVRQKFNHLVDSPKTGAIFNRMVEKSGRRPLPESTANRTWTASGGSCSQLSGAASDAPPKLQALERINRKEIVK